MTTLIIKKDINHYNRELGMRITSRRQYVNELKRRGLCTQEEGNDIADRAARKNHKDYKSTESTMKFLHYVKSHADKDGKVKLSGRELAHMQELGVNFKRPEYRGTKGGFDAV